MPCYSTAAVLQQCCSRIFWPAMHALDCCKYAAQLHSYCHTRRLTSDRSRGLQVEQVCVLGRMKASHHNKPWQIITCAGAGAPSLRIITGCHSWCSQGGLIY